jgi:V8-like Glu-specific endopeptidase
MTKDDYAVIQLDRKVTDRRPLSFRKSGKVSIGESVVVIGHPSGLPTKIADGAKVRSHSGKYFVANLDTYGGNSGSAVFNHNTGEVEGILVRGENDYIQSSRGCMVSNKCPVDGCRGEDVTYITNIKALQNL